MILVGVVVLVLAGLADFAMEFRDLLRDFLYVDHVLQLRCYDRLGCRCVSALRRVLRQKTPQEHAAGSIAAVLAALPLVDIAVVAEVTDDGLSVLAAAGSLSGPVTVAQVPCPRRGPRIFSIAHTQALGPNSGRTVRDQRSTTTN